MRPVRTALTIAGTDSGGGAGIAADLRTFLTCGVHGMMAVTAVTVQNSLRVSDIVRIPATAVAAQIEAVATDIGIDAAKTGMLASTDIIEAIAETCGRLGIGRTGSTPLVVDPVAASMHGNALLAPDAVDALLHGLFPLATLVTPNLDEVRLLTGIEVTTRAHQYQAARVLHGFGPAWVLVKGGHFTGVPDSVDVLYDGIEFTEFTGVRHDTPHTHGSGDTLASAITSALAKGSDIPAAVAFAKEYVGDAVRHAYPLGGGHGPVSSFWRVSAPSAGC